MKKKSLHIAFAALLLLLLGACSVKKNTWMSRTYHSTTTKFNIFFNGSESYKEGMTNIAKGGKDDYSRIIPMYAVSNHDALSSATGNMDRAIEKSRKAIKLHSIKKKPNKNFNKWNKPEYRVWYNQNEFNPALKEAWLMLAKSEFHKGDFLGSVGTFSYITKHYATVPDVLAEAQIWMARAYAEMGWIYEADEVLTKLSTETLNKKNTGLFSAAMADVLIRKKQYRDAIPYLKLAIEREKDGRQETRFKYVLAQLYEATEDKQGALEAYSSVIKSSPPYEMEFNARINRAQLLAGSNIASVEKELKSMARSRKNKEYLDQVYGALGNIFLNNKDTLKAMSYYAQAVEKSTRNSIEKGVSLVQLGDLYYTRKKYIKAEPNYAEAAKIFTAEYPDFPRISKRAEVLAELVKEDEVVVLQDSLLKLASLSETDRLAAINRVIEKIKKEEKEKKEREEEENNPNSRRNNPRNDDDFTMPMPEMIGAVNSSGSNWYFYNPGTVKSGKSDFQKKWGNRKLEDNWQRGNKSVSIFADNTTASVDNAAQKAGNETENQGNENTSEKAADNKSVDYYLRQIPFSAQQREKSNAQIADALFNMGFIFKDKMQDYPKAIETFEEFERRFGQDERAMKTLYQRFLIAARTEDTEAEQRYRTQMLSRYPKSSYADMLREPNFLERMGKMYREQDSIYNQTYAAYTRSDFGAVFKNVEYVKQKYPVSALLPKFEFLNALSIGKTQRSDLFKNSLDTLVAHYPKSDVSAMAKDILALMKQGNVAQLGKTHGSLLARRAEEAAASGETVDNTALSLSKEGKHRLLFIGNLNDTAMNKLLYNTAIFNFSRFMIKDFDIETGKINAQDRALSVTNLESFNEALWYEKTIRTDKGLSHLIDSLKVQMLPISEENFSKLRAFFTLEQYVEFAKENLLKDAPDIDLSNFQLAEKPKPIEKPKEEKLVAETAKKPEKETTKTSTKTEKKEAEKPIKTPEKKEPEKKEVAQTKEPEKKVTPPEEKKPEQKAEPETPEKVVETPQVVKPIEPEKPKVEEPVAWFRNTYAYRPNAPHFVALYVPTGDVRNFAEIQKVFDKYNAENYGLLNLRTSLERFGKQQAIIVGSFVDANTAKSYLLRMLKEQTLNDALKAVNRRNIIGTQENINIMVQKNDLNTYFEFMKEFYLK